MALAGPPDEGLGVSFTTAIPFAPTEMTVLASWTDAATSEVKVKAGWFDTNGGWHEAVFKGSLLDLVP